MAPAPVSQHFSNAHPNHVHPLMHHSDAGQFTCHACNTSGSGTRFRCHACPVDIHVYCADCPHEFSSFLHSHPLALVPRLERRICDVCLESIGGMLYRCEDCGFDVHPLCTQLPEEVRHVIDHNHMLRLKKLASSGNCAVCGHDCSSLWVYGCDDCGVNIHPKCLLKTHRREVPAAPPGSRAITHAPPPPPAHFPAGPFPYGYGYGYGDGYPSHGHAYYPLAVPNYHHYFAYHPSPPLPIYYGSVPFPHNNPSPWPNHGGYTRPSIGGSMFGSTMFSLVENIGVDVITEFIFGSIDL